MQLCFQVKNSNPIRIYFLLLEDNRRRGKHTTDLPPRKDQVWRLKKLAFNIITNRPNMTASEMSVQVKFRTTWKLNIIVITHKLHWIKHACTRINKPHILQ